MNVNWKIEECFYQSCNDQEYPASRNSGGKERDLVQWSLIVS